MGRAMKDSGVEWIGEIPEEWSVLKVKNVVSCNQDKGNFDGGAYIGLENIESGTGKLISPEGEIQIDSVVTKFTSKSVLFGKLRPYLAKVARPDYNGQCSTEILVLTPSEHFDKDYLFWCIINPMFIDYVNAATFGVKMPRASWNFIGGCSLPVPSSAEQNIIGTFLNSLCSKVDSIIDKTHVSIEEYKHLKQAVITQTVTKGVRGDRPMKDSGIEWVGDVPADWNVQRIKTIFSMRDEKNYLPLEEVNLISLYTDLGVVQHADLENTTGNKASNADGYKKVYENDIVVNIILCWMGAIGRSTYNGVTSPAYDIYVPSEEIDCRFYHYYFRTSGFSGDCYKNGRGIMAMRWRTYSDEFRNIRVVVPSKEEQTEIAAYLDEKCAEIDALIAQKEQLLTELENYKKSLIYEYVTGKKEVPHEH